MKFTAAKIFLGILAGSLILLGLILAGSWIPAPLAALRVILGTVFVLFVPGFALQAALFPHPSDLDPLARWAFSFGLSIAVIPPLFLILFALGLGIQLWTVATVLSVFVALCAIAAFFRARRLPGEDKRRRPLLPALKGWWSSQDPAFRILYAGLGVSLVAAIGSGIAVSQENPSANFTEFYLLDTNGLSMDYPRSVAAGAPVVFQLGINNHEGGPSEYNILVVRAKDAPVAAAGPILLSDGGTWTGSVSFELAQPGNEQEVDFFLERVGSPWPYRTLRVWMNVAAATGAAMRTNAAIDGEWSRRTSFLTAGFSPVDRPCG